MLLGRFTVAEVSTKVVAIKYNATKGGRGKGFSVFSIEKRHHKKELLSSFYLNGHTLEFHPQTQKLEPP